MKIEIFPVAGLKFYDCWKVQPEGSLIGKTVELKPEPTNPYDDKAIELYIRDTQFSGRKLGHVPRTDTHKFHEAMAAGYIITAKIMHHFEKSIIIEATILEDTTDSLKDGDPSEYGDSN